jgi:hypothetical protein
VKDLEEEYKISEKVVEGVRTAANSAIKAEEDYK